jgi:hypothetical protein
MLKKSVEPAKYPVVSLAQPARADDTQKPLLDHLGRLFQHPVKDF